MTCTFTQDFNRLDEDETDITVEYTYYGGCSPTRDHPGDPAAVEIVAAYIESGKTVEITQAEHDKFKLWLIENHEP